MPTPEPTSRALLVSFVEHLPPPAQRLICCGESVECTYTKPALLQACVNTLVNYGWTPHHIESFFLGSGLPFKAIDVFQRQYKTERTRQRELQRSIKNALKTKEDSHHCLHQLLDPACWWEEK